MMTESEALDLAAKAAGWGGPMLAQSIRAHAATLMENAALKAENEALKALRDDDGELLTIAWMDGAHRSNKAHREQIAALNAENERLREAARPFAFAAKHAPTIQARPHDFVLTSEFHTLAAALERIDHD